MSRWYENVHTILGKPNHVYTISLPFFCVLDISIVYTQKKNKTSPPSTSVELLEHIMNHYCLRFCLRSLNFSLFSLAIILTVLNTYERFWTFQLISEALFLQWISKILKGRCLPNFRSVNVMVWSRPRSVIYNAGDALKEQN